MDQETNIKFVKEVEKHEVLYNYHLSGYSRKEITEKAWQEVAAKVNMSAVECKEKWRNFRTVFMRKMNPLPSGSGAKKKAYYLAEAMHFCLPFIKSSVPPSSGNIPQAPQHEITEESLRDVEICDDSASLTQSPFTAPHSPKRIVPPETSAQPTAQPTTSEMPERTNYFQYSLRPFVLKEAFLIEINQLQTQTNVWPSTLKLKKRDWKVGMTELVALKTKEETQSKCFC
nr:uncharacterized protein LOC111421208 [Onthophagus taurus]